MINRRTFSTALVAGVATTILASSHTTSAQTAPKIRNVVLVHGAYADGSCWSEVVGLLQQAGFNTTVVQHPLTTLEAGVEATRRAIALQDGPTVLVGHSFAGMIVSEAGMDTKVSSLVYVAARARMRAKITRRSPRLLPRRRRRPGSSGPRAMASSVRRLSCGISPAIFLATRRASSTPSRGRSRTSFSPERRRKRPGARSQAGMRSRPRIARSIRISNASWPSA